MNLIVDSYLSHHSATSIQKAKKLNINFYFIPHGYTDLLQSLDIAIFTPLKSMTD